MKLLPVLSVVLSVLGGSQVTHASSAGAAALQAFKDIDFRFFVAGGTCAAISHGITTPIDVVKTRIQADPKKYDKGMLAASVDIVKAEGPGSLLSGLGPTVVGYGVEGAMKFGVYEVAKPLFAALLKDQKALAFIMASVIAGAVAAILLCPMESLRIRQVTDPKYAKDSLVTGLPRLVREDGFASLFGGILAMLAKQVPYTFGKQVSFDIIAATLYSVFSKISENVNKWVVSVCAAFCASLVACILSQPGDMILTETYKGSEPGSFGKVLNTISERGGIPEFFRGTGARIVHVSTIITSQLVIYDIVKQMLGLPATGSH
mmetsp:Transcript_116558/g.336690  ORF Transcript_116558/g.336690 Transcript_116558/m.336690 type:complete len:319 (-) Transcript_116558:494-1450(-)|eukprot:CAMPEP_0176024700 /NCGR_PEP_ID=MMETSP0120_2-20121206/12073_1 /TAXON_ID=160619 /ORGANISM="Kryptoperidinium foliaceum, Strain CCMP 1326" /LENGTH=318 /DNA_ID=CAMNT_0017357879 /DNA_START=82 /DNA_END=1038 /DNA_ORIENTATION=-